VVPPYLLDSVLVRDSNTTVLQWVSDMILITIATRSFVKTGSGQQLRIVYQDRLGTETTRAIAHEKGGWTLSLLQGTLRHEIEVTQGGHIDTGLTTTYLMYKYFSDTVRRQTVSLVLCCCSQLSQSCLLS
jgi:hypothetical protein